MMSGAFELEHISDDEGERGEVAVFSSPTADDWKALEEGISASLARGVLNWSFDLRDMRFCDSYGLGMWLRLNSMIREARGRASFLIRNPSRILELFRLTKLDQVLELTVIDAASEETAG